MDNGCIHAAVNAGDVEVLALLLRHGADPSAAGKGGWIPLTLAARSGKTSARGGAALAAPGGGRPFTAALGVGRRPPSRRRRRPRRRRAGGQERARDRDSKQAGCHPPALWRGGVRDRGRLLRLWRRARRGAGGVRGGVEAYARGVRGVRWACASPLPFPFITEAQTRFVCHRRGWRGVAMTASCA